MPVGFGCFSWCCECWCCSGHCTPRVEMPAEPGSSRLRANTDFTPDCVVAKESQGKKDFLMLQAAQVGVAQDGV